MNILEFPSDLLLEIFSYIDKMTMLASVRKVCQSFNRLSFDRSLWKTVSIKQFPWTVLFTTISFHELLSEAQNSVQCLHLDMQNLDDIGMLHEGITCTNLNELHIYASFCPMVDRHYDDLKHLVEKTETWRHIISLKKYLSSFGERYPNVKALYLQSDGLNAGYLSDKFLNLETFSISEGILQDSCREFFENHPSIKHLSLKSCIIEPSAVPIVSSLLPKLETLDFSKTTEHLYDDWDNKTKFVERYKLRWKELCFDAKKHAFISQICNKMPELRKLSINGSLVEDRELIEIAKHGPKLETVLINNSQWTNCYTTNEALFVIGASCKNLQVLHANYCSEVDNIGIQHIIESCPNLRELGIAKCTTLTDADIISLVDNCPRIQKLNLRECTGLTSKSISSILVGCKSLTDLDLQACYNLMNIRVTDDSSPNITATGEYSENETVELYKLEKEMINLDENTKDYQQNIKAHSHIRTLNLKYCGNLSDKCLEQISSFCPDLRDVDLGDCSSITNEGVTTLVQNCTLLEKLNLISISRFMNNPSKMSDECLLSIAKYCKNLRILIMVTNVHITADGIYEVIQNCPRLEHIKSSHGTRLFLDFDKMRNLTGKNVYTVEQFDNRSMDIFIYRDYSEQNVDDKISLKFGCLKLSINN